MITFYSSRSDPYSRAVKILATYLNIPLNEVFVHPFLDTITSEFLKVNIICQYDFNAQYFYVSFIF